MYFSLIALLTSFSLSQASLYQSGGWGLVISDPANALNCPSGTEPHSDADVTICCPNNYTSSDTSGIGARICCQPGTGCLAPLEASPNCADSSWVLWNQTQSSIYNAGFFCCLPGQQGEQTTDLIGCASGTFDSGYVAAQSVTQVVPTGTAAATITGGAAATNTAGSQTVTSTSKGGGLISSILSVATHHSDSRRIEPRPFNMPLLGVFGCSFTALALVGGFALVLVT